jgi:predicted RecA/RadA family phage recombinase
MGAITLSQIACLGTLVAFGSSLGVHLTNALAGDPHAVNIEGVCVSMLVADLMLSNRAGYASPFEPE